MANVVSNLKVYNPGDPVTGKCVIESGSI